MNDIRELIQAKLEEIQEIEVISSIPDDIMEIGRIYFTYSLQKFFVNKDNDKNYTNRIVLTGFVKAKDSSDIDIKLILDNYGSEIINKLKELNFNCDLIDVLDESPIKKMKISGSVLYNEINYNLI